MTRHPMPLQLYRPNRHITEPSILRDVLDVVAIALLALEVFAIVVLVFA